MRSSPPFGIIEESGRVWLCDLRSSLLLKPSQFIGEAAENGILDHVRSQTDFHIGYSRSNELNASAPYYRIEVSDAEAARLVNAYSDMVDFRRRDNEQESVWLARMRGFRPQGEVLQWVHPDTGQHYLLFPNEPSDRDLAQIVQALDLQYMANRERSLGETEEVRLPNGTAMTAIPLTEDEAGRVMYFSAMEALMLTSPYQSWAERQPSGLRKI